MVLVVVGILLPLVRVAGASFYPWSGVSLAQPITMSWWGHALLDSGRRGGEKLPRRPSLDVSPDPTCTQFSHAHTWCEPSWHGSVKAHAQPPAQPPLKMFGIYFDARGRRSLNTFSKERVALGESRVKRVHAASVAPAGPPSWYLPGWYFQD